MALFESYERRIDKINEVLGSYGIASIEEAEKITKDAGLDVYNQIKLIYENKQKVKKGKKKTTAQNTTYEIYMTKNSASINKWGVLQYVDKINSPDVGKAKSKALLKLYNKKQRTLSIKGVVGNKNVRAGSLVPVILDLQDIKLSNYMLVEKVTHTFNNREHTMDLTVSGGDFVDG